MRTQRKKQYFLGWVNYAMLLALSLYCFSIVTDYACSYLFEMGLNLDVTMLVYNLANGAASLFFSFFVYRWSVRRYVAPKIASDFSRHDRPHKSIEKSPHIHRGSDPVLQEDIERG